MVDPITPKTTIEIQEFFADWINDTNNITDPYFTASGKVRTDFAYAGDFKMMSNTPTIQVDCGDQDNKRISMNKNASLNQREHQLMIFYSNRRAKGTFNSLVNEAQCRGFLEYLRDAIQDNMSDFGEVCHMITFGTIPKPIWDEKRGFFTSVLPVTVYTYRRAS
ncbi:MAG: hypothetical protein GY861_17565 [bacterium]|nr:hypothetical protein [bacterium]